MSWVSLFLLVSMRMIDGKQMGTHTCVDTQIYSEFDRNSIKRVYESIACFFLLRLLDINFMSLQCLKLFQGGCDTRKDVQ